MYIYQNERLLINIGKDPILSGVSIAVGNLNGANFTQMGKGIIPVEEIPAIIKELKEVYLNTHINSNLNKALIINNL